MRLSKDYNLTRWIITVVVTITIIVVTMAWLKENIVLNTWGFFILCELFVPMLIIKGIFLRIQWRKLAKQVSVYEDNCDPQNFLLLSQNFTKEITLPYDTWDIWYLDFRCLALCDTGSVEAAEAILAKVLISIEDNDVGMDASDAQNHRAPKTIKKAIETYNIFPAYASLRSRKAGLELIEGSSRFFSSDPKKYEKEFKYISNQKAIMVAEESGDPMQVVSIWKINREDPKSSLRAKVVSAYFESRGYRALFDTENERELLNYVVRYGSKLQVGGEALKRLKELDAE